MRLALNPRGVRLSGRLLARMPRPTVYSAVELTLLILIAVQCARLFWILVSPIGPVGDWKAPATLAVSADSAVLGAFDPFFRLAGPGGPVVVTSLNLKLHGVREDRATGRGSAIIALPDGRQFSFAVGEEVMPGVILAAVAFDSVTLSRSGAAEQIFLDQSAPAQAAGGAVAPPAPVLAVPATPIPTIVATPPAGAPPINFQPRMDGGRITGVVVSPGANGEAFLAAGFAPGDVIVAVNGARVTSMEQAWATIGQGRGEAAVTVERGGRNVAMRVRLNR